ADHDDLATRAAETPSHEERAGGRIVVSRNAYDGRTQPGPHCGRLVDGQRSSGMPIRCGCELDRASGSARELDRRGIAPGEPAAAQRIADRADELIDRHLAI